MTAISGCRAQGYAGLAAPVQAGTGGDCRWNPEL